MKLKTEKVMSDNYELPLIAVIIPVYNIQSYLRRCMDSVLNQTYTNLEIILVDDGSTDQSGSICDEYANTDARIKVIHKKNGGLSSARNAAIDVMRGKYVTFIDSDDYVSVQYVERLFWLVDQYQADISEIGMIRFRTDYVKEKDMLQVQRYSIKQYNAVDAIKEMWYQKNVRNSAWGKLYRSELFERKKVRYPEGRWYEDLGTTYKLLGEATRIVCSSENLYYYFERSGSIMNSRFERSKLDRIILSTELLQWAEKEHEELIEAAITRLFISNIQVLRELPLDKKYEQEKESIKESIKKYRRHVVKNKEAKNITKMIAICSVLNFSVLKKMGSIYKWYEMINSER